MSILKKVLKVTDNKLNSYFPSRTTTNEEAFDWGVAQGIVVRNIYKTIIKPIGDVKKIEDELEHNLASFRKVCHKDFVDRVDEPELWSYVNEMYFSGDALYRVAPESLLFKLSGLTANSRKHNLGNMFSSLMQDFYVEEPAQMKRNFLEQQVVDSLCSKNVLAGFNGCRMSKGVNEKPFLPFLTDYFQQDLSFLVSHPRYLIDNLQELLKLYGYLYTAQMALNINGWRAEPSSKPLYFIMENETASLERLSLVKDGHQKVAEHLKYLFPYLTVAESLQSPDAKNDEHRLPLWELSSKLTVGDAPALRAYAEEFANNRNKDREYTYPHIQGNPDPLFWLEDILKTALRQFDKGNTRAAAQAKFIKSTELELCSTFVKNRGRAGKVLVMNQDYLLLLTNVSIGIRDKLRFHELLDVFQARGVYFDKKSQQSLIRFYERVGNVERMSDSGDAVYVRKTV